MGEHQELEVSVGCYRFTLLWQLPLYFLPSRSLFGQFHSIHFYVTKWLSHFYTTCLLLSYYMAVQNPRQNDKTFSHYSSFISIVQSIYELSQSELMLVQHDSILSNIGIFFIGLAVSSRKLFNFFLWRCITSTRTIDPKD